MKKILVLLLMLVVCITSFTGCKEKVTAESIMLKVGMNTKDAKSMSANMVMNMDMAYDMEGVTGAIAMVMDMDMDIQLEPMSMYMNMAMTMNADGMTEEQISETYITPGENEDEVIVYTGMEDMWYKEVGSTSEYMDMSDQFTLAASMGDNEGVTFELAEETTTVNGKEAYVLEGTMKGELLQEMLSSLKDMEALLGTEVDLTNAEATMNYLVYKENFMPAEMNLDISEFMAGLLSESGITFETVKLKYVFESFDQTTVTVPEEVVSGAIEGSAEDGTMTGEDVPAEDVLIDSTDSNMAMAAVKPETPIAMNEWGSTYTLLEDGTYFQVAARIVGVERGEAVDALVKSINDTAGSEILGELHENLEYCLVGYEVYVPMDYPDETFMGVELYLTDTEGLYFETEYEFDDMYWVEVVDDTNMHVGPGETAQIVGIYTMEKDRTEYLFEIGDSWFNEVYVAISE